MSADQTDKRTEAEGREVRMKRECSRIQEFLDQFFTLSLRASLNTWQFKKKVTLSHVYNEVTSEPTITRHTTIVRKILKVCNWRGKVFRAAVAKGDGVAKWRSVSCRIQNAFCCAVAILQHGLPGGGGPKHFPASNTNKLLRFFLTIVKYRAIVGSLVTSL
jgi:hypothetical protein